ncbi:MAG TPA: enoyl-CoA hydratase/isomerase family protein, partial [Acidimicrobiales bacterium]|nr:enoyl-CoA hydratase/isomerase family protein [Acidimicrobiales bacterium]
GVALAAACPLVLVSADAWFALPERDLGMFPSGVLAFLEPLIGPRRALEFGLTGARIDAVTAQRLGLANEVVPGVMDHALRSWLDLLLADVLVTSSAAAAWRTRFSTDEFRARKAVLDALLVAADGRQL